MNGCTIQERTLILLIRGDRGPFGRACRHSESTGEAGGADECMIARLDPFIIELTTVTYKQGATTLGTLTYTYDAAGNRIKTGGTFARSNLPPALATTNYNANNQQLTFGTTTETYDLNGNLATTTDAGVTTTYTWNARNQLTGISKTGFTASFTYDSFGRRTGKTVQGTTTNFLYDGLNPVQEKNGATVTANLLTGLGIDEFFTRTDSVGVRSLLPDALGSTVALGDGTGALQTQYTYEPYGVTTLTGAASTNSYKYTGREDDGSGLYYCRARYYQPRLQRFIAGDPIGFLGGDVNLYGYVGGAPISYADPSGQFAWIPAGAVIGAAVNVGITYIANGGNVTGYQLAAAAVSGAISGGLGAAAGPLGGSIAQGLGTISSGLGAAMTSGVLSALGSAVGQAASNLIDPCNATNPLNAALWGGVGGGLAKGLFPTKNLNTVSQATSFGAKTLSGLVGSPNALLNIGALATSAGVGGAANFPGVNPF